MRAADVQPRVASGARVKTAILATTLLALGTLPARAQDTVQTLPGVDRFELPPGNSQTTPTPSQTPTPSPTPSVVTPPPVVRTVPSPAPSPRPVATRTPALRPTPTPASTPRATETPLRATGTPTPAPTATPSTVGAAAPLPSPTPAVAPQPTVAATPAAAATSAAEVGPPAWLWWLAGLGLAGGAGFALVAGRRKRAKVDDVVYQPVAPPPAPPRPAQTPKPQPSPWPAAPVSPTATPARPLALDFRPQRLWTRGPNAYLAFELVLTNAGSTPLAGVRPVVTLASAGPDTAAELAGFAAQLSSLPGGEPFDLRVGETRKVAGELTLPGDAMHVTTVAEREMIVPVAMIGMVWRGGLSVASAAEAFVIGVGDPTSAKLGPVWVDRPGQIYGRLDARRFTPR